MNQRAIVVGAVLLGAVALAACTGGDDTSSTSSAVSTPAATEVSATAAPATPTAVTATAEATAPQSIGGIRSTLVGTNEEFNYGAAVWQGYWLSRDHFGPFVMGSGLGIPFTPPMEMLGQAMAMVAQNPDDAVTVPSNMMPLQAIFASGSPKLVNNPLDFDPLDFEALRLDPSTFDQTVRVRGQAETMLKESQWARNFSSAHFGSPDDDFGAQQRFIGVMVNLLSQMQGQYAMQNLLSDDGLYYDSDGELDYAGNWVMLQVLSDIAGIAAADGTPYTNPEMAATFDGAATMLYQALSDRAPQSGTEATLAIRALTFRAWTANDDELRSGALSRARAIADDVLLAATSDDIVEAFAAIAGLISVDVVQGDGRYSDAASALFEELVDSFDAENGVFTVKSTYSVDDVAWIIGGLNSLILEGDADARAAALPVFVTFFESTLDVSGLQLSAPPGKNGAMAGEFEKNLASVVYYHGADTPPPPMVGMLTVPAREISWDGSAWSVTDTTFEPAGAMHLANELNWLGPHLGALLFPPVSP
jgi:hypothetical protein